MPQYPSSHVLEFCILYRRGLGCGFRFEKLTRGKLHEPLIYREEGGSTILVEFGKRAVARELLAGLLDRWVHVGWLSKL